MAVMVESAPHGARCVFKGQCGHAPAVAQFVHEFRNYPVKPMCQMARGSRGPGHPDGKEIEVSTTDDKIIKRISDCLRLANHPGAQIPPGEPGHNEALWNEAQTAQATAVKLMVQHDIDSATFDVSDPDATRKIIMVNIMVKKPGAKANDENERTLLAISIGDFFSCRHVIQSDRHADTKFVCLMGFENDTVLAQGLYSELVMVMATEGAKAMVARIQAAEKVDPAAHMSSFSRGFVTTVAGRLEDMARARRAAAQKEKDGVGNSMALVLVKKDDMVASAFKEQFPNLRTVSLGGRGKVDPTAAAAGRRAGANADLGGSRVGGGGNKSLGRG